MRTIDGYDLVRELARGGMGVVYEALDRETGRPVALKLLLAVSDPAARARFLVEGQAAARLRHPGIVAVHSMGEAGGAPYLVMDLVRGETLERRLKRAGPFAAGDVVRVATAAAEALAHAHAQGIVHRDLKPSNIMLDEAGRVLLTDFGVAKLIDGAPLTRTGDLLGTPSFMAPEQLDGRRADARTDVYGLGATVFALLTGRPPFDGPLMQVLGAVVNKPAPRPSSVRGDVPPALDDLVLACLQKDPGARPASMTALAQALAGAQAPAPGRRPSRALPALAAALLLAGGLVAAAVLRAPPPPPAPAPAAPPAPPAPAIVAPVATATESKSVEPPLEPLDPRRADEVRVLHSLGLRVEVEDVERLVPSSEGHPVDLEQALVWRAKARRSRNELEAALRDLDRLQTVAPERARTERELRMEVLVRLGREEALQLIDADLDDADLPPDRVCYLGLARSQVLVGLGRTVEARAGLREVLARLPEGDDRLLLHWAGLCLNLEPFALEEVIEVLGPAIERRPTAPALLQHRAAAFARLGRMPEALEDASRALALVPDDGQLHLVYGQWLLMAQDPLAGAAALEQAVTVAPDDLQLRHQVGNVYEQWRLLDQALRHRRAALARSPGNVMFMEALARTEQLLAERARAPRR